MPKEVETLHKEFTFTDEEFAVAAVFGEYNTAWLQTLRSRINSQQALLMYDPDSPNSKEAFLIEHSYLRGQLEILNYALNISEDIKVSTVEEIRAKMNTALNPNTKKES